MNKHTRIPVYPKVLALARERMKSSNAPISLTWLVNDAAARQFHEDELRGRFPVVFKKSKSR